MQCVHSGAADMPHPKADCRRGFKLVVEEKKEGASNQLNLAHPLIIAQTCKPGSVTCKQVPYHLSDAAYPPAKSEQPLTAGIHGLAECSGVRIVYRCTKP